MPFVSSSSYVPPRGYANGHVQTIYTKLFRRVPDVPYERERITTPDGDFLDLDWCEPHHGERVAILSHGLEGSSDGTYIRAMIHALRPHGWDAVAWNCRGCSGEPNRTSRFYHSGATEDLGAVVSHVLRSRPYRTVALIGYSMGGNMTLKYLGEQGHRLDERIRAGVAFSVPCDLRSSSLKLALSFNRAVYTARFMHSLRRKIRAKQAILPPHIHDRNYHTVRTFKDFDDRYTAPLHGFTDAEDYWRRASSRPFLAAIHVPTLLVNARDDPFLDEPSFPVDIAQSSRHFWLEAPQWGGHVGFVEFRRDGQYWSERRAVRFLSEVLA